VGAPGWRSSSVSSSSKPAVCCRASPLDSIKNALLGGNKVAPDEEEGLGEMAPLDSSTPHGEESVFGPTVRFQGG